MKYYDLTDQKSEHQSILSWLVQRRFDTAKQSDDCLYMAGYKDALDELSELLDQGYIE